MNVNTRSPFATPSADSTLANLLVCSRMSSYVNRCSSPFFPSQIMASLSALPWAQWRSIASCARLRPPLGSQSSSASMLAQSNPPRALS